MKFSNVSRDHRADGLFLFFFSNSFVHSNNRFSLQHLFSSIAMFVMVKMRPIVERILNTGGRCRVLMIGLHVVIG